VPFGQYRKKGHKGSLAKRLLGESNSACCVSIGDLGMRNGYKIFKVINIYIVKGKGKATPV
jgi:hypothetical protein